MLRPASTGARGEDGSRRVSSSSWSRAVDTCSSLLRSAGVPLLLSAALGTVAIGGILARTGQPALPLDDAFIHLQYARSLAEARFFEYVPTEGYTTGATSWLWPALLAPFWRLGLRDLELVWAAWLLGGLAHAATTLETARVARGLCGRTGAVLAGAMCAFFGAFAWFAWSGMETMLLAWVLIRTVRVASECRETRPAPAGRRAELALLGMIGPLVRPEGAICSLVALLGAWGAASPPRRPARPIRRVCGQALAIGAPLAGLLLIPGTHLVLTGHPGSSTAQVKWLPLDPTLELEAVVSTVLGQARFLVGDLLQGNAWTTIFLPDGFGTFVILGLGAVTLAGLRPGWVSLEPRQGPRSPRLWRAGFVWLLALGTLIPASYATMLWNRVRYIYAFAPAWFVALGCLGCLIGTGASRLRPGLAALAPLLLGGMVGALASKLPWALGDLAQSASAIDRQQVALARWAHGLPAEARIGVNDTGAIAYLSGRRTFDVVGLTTATEARHWMAGAGARFEHYERLGAARLPTHLIVYPEWFGCPPLLGQELSRATVLDQSILGGVTMVAYETRTDLLDSGQLPFGPGRRGALLDALDVADLESEQAHHYGGHPARGAADVVGMWPTPDGRVVADGGRSARLEDRFVVSLRSGRAAVMVLRVSPHGPMAIALGGERLLATEIVARGEPWWSGWRPTEDPKTTRDRSGYEPWVERSVLLPAQPASPVEIVVRSADGGTFTAYHYWWFEPLGAEADGAREAPYRPIANGAPDDPS